MLEIDKRMLYILPSVLSIAISITVFLFEFGNFVVDMKNVCYTVFVNLPDNYSEEEFVDSIRDIVSMEDIQGFTVVKNELGGYNNNGEFETGESYQIILMDISRKEANTIAKHIQEEFETEVLISTSRTDISHISG